MADGTDADEVLVVGAGIVGTCTAIALAERGTRVSVLDRDEPGSGTSFGNAGVVSPWSFVPQGLPDLPRRIPRLLLDPASPLKVRAGYWPRMLGWGTRFLAECTETRARANSAAMATLVAGNVELYRRWLVGTGGEGTLVDSLYLHVFRGGARADLDAWPFRLRRERGGRVERIDGAALHDLEPALASDCHEAIVVGGQARARSSADLVRALARRARHEGARFVRCEVRALRPRDGGGFALATGTGTRVARRVVLAAGIGSAELLRDLGVRLPLAAERGYHVELVEPGVTLGHSVMDVAGRFVASSMPDALRVAGTAEFADPGAPPDWRRAERLADAARALLPGLRARGTRRWLGARPSFPDSLPAIGPLEALDPALAGLHAAFGHGHYGMSTAPATARWIASLVDGERPNADLAPYRPERFARGEGRAAGRRPGAASSVSPE